ncbi:hypothetical protein [Clostridium sp.]|jgi:hypothetical protein|uniref:hypothetical protein n=1 Tax=Clostridium sp. TaxID=1506 RepID=UPI003EEF92E2
MENYLFDQKFNLYHGGVLIGKIVFKEKGVEVLPVDPKTRVQLKEISLKDAEYFHSLMPLQALHQELAGYTSNQWREDRVTLPNGIPYNRYRALTGNVNN